MEVDYRTIPTAVTVQAVYKPEFLLNIERAGSFIIWKNKLHFLWTTLQKAYVKLIKYITTGEGLDDEELDSAEFSQLSRQLLEILVEKTMASSTGLIIRQSEQFEELVEYCDPQNLKDFIDNGLNVVMESIIPKATQQKEVLAEYNKFEGKARESPMSVLERLKHITERMNFLDLETMDHVLAERFLQALKQDEYLNLTTDMVTRAINPQNLLEAINIVLPRWKYGGAEQNTSQSLSRDKGRPKLVNTVQEHAERPRKKEKTDSRDLFMNRVVQMMEKNNDLMVKLAAEVGSNRPQRANSFRPYPQQHQQRRDNNAAGNRNTKYGRCHNCQKLGHWARDCKSPKRANAVVDRGTKRGNSKN